MCTFVTLCLSEKGYIIMENDELCALNDSSCTCSTLFVFSGLFNYCMMDSVRI